MRHGMRVIAAAATLALAPPAGAAFFDREAAVDHALSHNPRLDASQASIGAAEADLEAARSAGSAQVALTASGSASNNPLDAFSHKLQAGNIEADMAAMDFGDFDPDELNNPDPSFLMSTGVEVRYPLYTGGRVSAGVQGAESAREAAELGHLRAREVIAYQTRRAYLAVQAAERGLAIAEDAVAAARDHAETTRRLVRDGRIVESDQLTAEVNLNEMEANRDQARQRVRQARNRLRLAMGLDRDEPLEVAELPPVDEMPELAGLETLQAEALASRRDLQSLRAQQAAQRARVDMEEAAYGPQVNLVASGNTYGENSAYDNTAWRAMAQVRYQLWDGGTASSKAAAARQRTERVRAEIADRERAIRNEVRQAVDDIELARERLQNSRGTVERARENVTQVDRRYGQGRTILIDVLQAEGRLVKARNEVLSARHALQAGLLQLSAAQGRLLEENQSVTGEMP
ncbi:Outer membrane protein TolC [Thiohalospira halophila DSM 15071]|uniref:Outer membrane protein TolC n=1 Tax=Thiohalospira halophila DSM 15071 TaxID=1123397 RepID=A0A1I1P681_9GAMM|nr:TolC family protein [Thiohalospira halophila]SFD05461.1 Outer membrane protein TolC [Thiohalospira halophila DSM 15071]